MQTVRLGIIGVGNMGSGHARNIVEGKVPRMELVAVCDADPARLSSWSPAIKTYATPRELLRLKRLDAVLIATPHFSHTACGVSALRSGVHVLIEKPISVHKADAEKLIAAHKKPGQLFAAMFNQRTDPFFRRIKQIITDGTLGPLQRIQWTITDWYRTDAYYTSSGWRATWSGEGGGVLLNQAPHNLDLFQWFFGMPQRLRAFAGFGKYHAIEVEDEVTAFMEYENGCTATFITTTGETPGTNRLEIAGDLGKLVYESDRLKLTLNTVGRREHSRTCKGFFDRPTTRVENIVYDNHGGQHVEILKNFADAILDGTPVFAPAAEGIHSVELANAMILSADKGQTIELPIKSSAYASWLKKKSKK